MGNHRRLAFHLIFVCAFLVAVTYTCLGDGNTSVVCSDQERIALLKFKNSVTDHSGMLSSWVGNDCCLWEGIHCDTTVESLHIRGCLGSEYEEDGCYLYGNEVNYPSLAELRHLKHLDLSGNDFERSQIPNFIGSLKRLTYLNLSGAGFQGIIPPHIGNLSNLKVLDLRSYGGLMVDDMAWTSGLSSLEYLDLSFVDLSGAQNKDMVFYMIPSLQELSLSNCGLSIADLGPFRNLSIILPNIKHLDLSANFFQGPLPGFFQNMSSLTFLHLSDFNLGRKYFKGNIANLPSMIPSLSSLYLSDCGLDKTHLSFPRLNLSTLSNIQHLVLGRNSIQGIFPSVFTNMSSLRVLDLSQNMLNSSIPTMPNLLNLDLSSNQLIGPISTFLANYSKLDLSFNKLNGSIPQSFGNLSALTYLDLSFNRLTQAPSQHL